MAYLISSRIFVATVFVGTDTFDESVER